MNLPIGRASREPPRLPFFLACTHVRRLLGTGIEHRRIGMSETPTQCSDQPFGRARNTGRTQLNTPCLTMTLRHIRARDYGEGLMLRHNVFYGEGIPVLRFKPFPQPFVGKTKGCLQVRRGGRRHHEALVSSTSETSEEGASGAFSSTTSATTSTCSSGSAFTASTSSNAASSTSEF